MTQPLVSDAQMASLRELGKAGLQTDVTIWRLSVNDGLDSGAYGSEATWTELETVKGWLRSAPALRNDVGGGMLSTDNQYRLFLEVGTDCRTGDRVVIDGNTFVVIDTTAESTWKVYLRLTLRRKE